MRAIRARRIGGFIVIAAIDDDSAKRNKTSLSNIYYIGPAQYVGVRLEAILATVPQRRIVSSRFFTIDSLAARGFRSTSRTPIFTPVVCVRVTGPDISPHKFSQSQSTGEKLTRVFHAKFSFCPRDFSFFMIFDIGVGSAKLLCK